ncbi:MAG: polysaccharide deacetylase family protein, partial [Pseudomonadota bacterium]
MRNRRSPFAGRLYLPVVVSSLLFAGAAHACLGVERTITLDGDKSFYGVGNGGNMGLRHKEVVLTFDDGPSPYTTNKILRTLRQHCTKATFFVVGSMARAYPST